jgi:hypothetical protein
MTDMPEEITLGDFYAPAPMSEQFYSVMDDKTKMQPRKQAKYIRADLVPRWQTIDSAPKDGTRVMLYVPPYGAMCGHNQFTINPYMNNDVWHLSSCLNKEAQPTHWMPLPQPPNNESP